MSIHLVGALLLMLLLVAFASGAEADSEAPRVLTDFSATSPVTWTTVNDGVMGGRSRGGFRVSDGVLVFQGSTNTNGGGFSSIRSRRGDFDLTGHEGVRLRVKADGRRYTFRLTTASSGRASYWADFETRKDGSWEIIDVPFARFTPRWRGRILSGPALNVATIDSLGLMIYDKLDGPFRMDVDWIQAYRQQPKFSMASYVGKRRPLLLFAPRQADARLAQQLANIEATRGEFQVRDMTLIVVLEEGRSKAGAMPLTAAEVSALRTTHGVTDGAFAIRLIGKDGRVKRSRAEVADMATLYALIDTMPMRQREMESARPK